ncbi:hypothetical protein [Singulisphaera sp. PoT]|uniref:hypothetical protein n=1 Tax=Singulisphaera sp. PoT TaxID=3411797 RepID=UPI003BF5166E
MQRCGTCPFEGGECLAAKMKVRRLCDLADPGHPDHRPGYREFLARGGVELQTPPPSRPFEVIAEENRGDDEPRPTGVFAPISRLNQHLEILEIINECDYRSLVDKGWETGCGCNPTWVCSQRRGSFRGKEHEVSKSECISCVASR